MNVAFPVSAQLDRVDFSLLGKKEIKAISVKKIVNPVTFDTLEHPVPGGLHDLALGAFLDNP